MHCLSLIHFVFFFVLYYLLHCILLCYFWAHVSVVFFLPPCPSLSCVNIIINNNQQVYSTLDRTMDVNHDDLCL